MSGSEEATGAASNASESLLPLSMPPREFSGTPPLDYDAWPRVNEESESSGDSEQAKQLTSGPENRQQDEFPWKAGATSDEPIQAGADKDEAVAVLAVGIESLMGPPMRECNSHVEAAFRSQERLLMHVTRLTEELDKMLEHAPPPLMTQQAARLAVVRKRILSLTATLQGIQGRINGMHHMITDREATQLSPSPSRSASLRSTWTRLSTQSRSSSAHSAANASPLSSLSSPVTPEALTSVVRQIRSSYSHALPRGTSGDGPAGGSGASASSSAAQSSQGTAGSSTAVHTELEDEHAGKKKSSSEETKDLPGETKALLDETNVLPEETKSLPEETSILPYNDATPGNPAAG